MMTMKVGDGDDWKLGRYGPGRRQVNSMQARIHLEFAHFSGTAHFLLGAVPGGSDCGWRFEDFLRACVPDT